MDPKHERDEALNVADFKIDDILNLPGDQLLAEVAEDFGDPAFLAAQFDSIALPGVSSHNRGGLNRGGASATFPVQPAALGAASVRAFSRPARPRSFSRAALAILAVWLVAPLRRPIFLGTFATLLLVAALTPGVYPLLVDRSPDRMTTPPQDQPSTQLPASTLSGPVPTRNPDPVGPDDQSQVEVEREQALQQPSSARSKQLRAVARGGEQAAGSDPARVTSAAVAPPPAAQKVAVAAPAAAPAAAPPAARAPSAARVTEGGGFFVQLSAPRSEAERGTVPLQARVSVQLSAPKSAAEAQSTFQALRSKYAVLKGHEPVIRRKDEGQRGVIYAIQVGPFESLDDAEGLCERLKTAGGICFVTRN